MSSAQLSPGPAAPPSGPRRGRVALGVRARPRPRPPECAWGRGSSLFLHRRAQRRRDRGRRWGGRQRGLELEWNRDWSSALPSPPHRGLLGRGGDGVRWDLGQVGRPERGRPRWGRGRAGTWAARGSDAQPPAGFAEQTSPTRAPAGAPPRPGALPGGRRCTEPRLFSPGAVCLVT